MNYEYPDHTDDWNGLKEEMNSDIAKELTVCPKCGNIVHIDNLHDGVCEDCWDDDSYADDESYEDDVWADADTLAGAGYGTDEDYGCFGGDEDY